MPFLGASSTGASPAVSSQSAILDVLWPAEGGLAAGASYTSNPLVIVGCSKVVVIVNFSADAEGPPTPPIISLQVTPLGSQSFGPWRTVTQESAPSSAVGVPYYRSVDLAGQAVRVVITNPTGSPDTLSGSLTIIGLGV